MKAERIVEIGPADTLTNMMKRTCDRDYAAHDAALNIHRRILGSQADIEEIRYEGQGEREADPQPDGKEQAQPVPEKSVPTPAESAPNEELDRVADAAADEVPDAPVTAAAVVTSLVAVKLKKAYSEINTSHSIKRLGEGRSSYWPFLLTRPANRTQGARQSRTSWLETWTLSLPGGSPKAPDSCRYVIFARSYRRATEARSENPHQRSSRS